MMPLSPPDIESELSYAYVHAVAARAGVSCQVLSRHQDNRGIDALLTGWGPYSGLLKELDIKVQLKATIKKPADLGDCFSYPLTGISRYEDLRRTDVSTLRILVVLFLPEDTNAWLECSKDALTLRKCAYWESLRGAPASSNTTSQTVYLPKQQRFDPKGLHQLMDQLSHHKFPSYGASQP